MYVKMWVVSSKTTNSSTLADTNIATNFFDGNSAPLGFQNNISRLYLYKYIVKLIKYVK